MGDQGLSSSPIPPLLPPCPCPFAHACVAATVTELPPAAQAAQATLAAHASPLGAIVAMTLHPELPGLILIVGGLGWGLCQPSSLEDLPPFFLSPSAPAAHTCGRWSPTRPGGSFPRACPACRLQKFCMMLESGEDCQPHLPSPATR